MTSSFLEQLLGALAQIEFAPVEQGVPAGGTSGQFLTKASEDNFDTTWSDGPTGGGGTTGPIVDADVDANAAIKSSKLAFSQNEADTASFPLRSAYHRLRETISVMDAAPANMEVADHSVDATPWFQEVIEYAVTRRSKKVFVPAHAPGSYYKCGSSEIVITGPISIEGEHPLVTIGNQAGGLGSTGYLFKVDGTVAPNYEQFSLKNLSLRPELGGTRCRGLLLKRVAYPVLEDIVISNGVRGIEITGDRGYASSFNRVHVNGCSDTGIMVSNYTGGGHHNFHACSLNSNVNGFHLASDSVMSGVNFFGFAFEQNTGRPFRAEGTIHGINFTGCYAEQNTFLNGHTLGFVPASGKTQRGITIHGGIWDTDNEAFAFLFGGDGTVRSIDIRGLEAEGYSLAMVHSFSGGVSGGQITSNYLNAIPAVATGGPTRVSVTNNEGNGGAIA